MRARGCNCAPARRAGIPRRNSHTAFSGCEQVGVRLTERQQREKKRVGVLKNRRFKSRASAGFYVSLDTCAEGFPFAQTTSNRSKAFGHVFFCFFYGLHTLVHPDT